MKHVPNRFPITRKMVPVFNLIQKYKRKLNKARKHIYFYRLVLKTTLPDFAFSIVPSCWLMAAKAVKIVYIFKTNIIFFSGTNILLFQKIYTFQGKVYTFQVKTLYFSGKRYILFSQKVYIFLVKSIYFFSERNNALVYIWCSINYTFSHNQGKRIIISSCS